jgi:hypothetical protein
LDAAFQNEKLISSGLFPTASSPSQHVSAVNDPDQDGDVDGGGINVRGGRGTRLSESFDIERAFRFGG